MDKSLITQLRDIDGLDAISWWPPAPGWWMLAALVLTLGAGLLMLRRYRQKKAAGWQAQARKLFAALHTESNAKKKAAALSALLRRLAMRRFGRTACAGLEGAAWLDWLAQNDPAQFDWRVAGRPLIQAPYMPDDAVSSLNVEPLIAAAERWVR